MSGIAIPEAFVRAVREVHGEAGAAWLDEASTLLRRCVERWSLTVAPPFPNLCYGYVAPAICADGTKLVLKLAVPDREFRTSVAALQLFAGRGAVRLIEADPAGAMLLERLDPGTSLVALFDVGKDDEATMAAASVIKELWREAPREHDFPAVADWAGGIGRLRARFGGGCGPLPERLLDRAEGLFVELLGSMDRSVLLHGDLHHGNILAAGREPWLAIDPKGVIGEPAYEAGAYLRNPMAGLLDAARPQDILARRLDILAEALGLDRCRLHGWGLAQAVLAACWSVEDHGAGWEPWIACAELLVGLDAPHRRSKGRLR